jgi:dienelactone hydrolase
MKIFVLLASFTLVTSVFSLPKIDQKEIEQRKKLFNYQSPFLPVIHEVISKQKSFTHYRGKLVGPNPVLENNPDISVRYHYFKSTQSGPRPTIIVLPPFIGYTIMDLHIATSFARDGFHVVVPLLVDDIFDTDRPITDIDGFFIRNIVTVRMIIDLLELLPEVKKDGIGGFGMSLGGIRLATLMGVDSRVRAGALYISGGDIPHTLTYSSLAPIERWRDKRMKELNLEKRNDFRKLLNNQVLIDPLHFSDENKKENIYMVLGKRDTVVPSINQEKLWDAYGRPQADFVKYGGHYSTGATYLYKMDKIKKFLNEKL